MGESFDNGTINYYSVAVSSAVLVADELSAVGGHSYPTALSDAPHAIA